jgi:hypothetical protein
MKIYWEAGSSFFKDDKYYTFNAKGYIEIEIEETKEVSEEIEIEETKEVKKPLQPKKK